MGICVCSGARCPEAAHAVTSPQALEGLLVLDCSQVMAGPYAALQLATMGAEVIKIEPPSGDTCRTWGPFVGEHSMAFVAVNCGKKSVVLDLRVPEDVARFRALVRCADVLIENYRPGTMDRLGLGYEVLRSDNPSLIYCAVSGYGQTGPYAAQGGYDLMAQGYSGIMSVTGEPGGPPVKAGIPVTDLGAALFAVQGILAALLHRDRTGEGQFIDTSLFDAGVALSVWEAHTYFAARERPAPLGSAHRLLAPYQAFAASDGYFTVGAGPQRLWERFCRLLGLERLIDDPVYADPPKRVANRQGLQDAIEAVTRTQTRAHWLETLQAAGIPAGPIYGYDEVFADPHTAARGLLKEVELAGAGRVHTLGPALKLSATPLRIGAGAPRLGEHTEEVLASLRTRQGRRAR